MLRTISICTFTFLLGGGLTWMLVAPWGEREGPPVLAAGPVDVPWGDVLAVLERIEARLEMPSPSGLPSRDESGRAPASQPMVEEDLRAMATALDELRLAVEANMSGGAGRMAGASSLQELKDKNAEPNWPALNDLIRHWSLDEDLALRETWLLSYRDVLERYGTPSRTYQNERGFNWLYADGRDPITGASQQVVITFNDGLVMRITISVR